jgi:hypothetical protein
MDNAAQQATAFSSPCTTTSDPAQSGPVRTAVTLGSSPAWPPFRRVQARRIEQGSRPADGAQHRPAAADRVPFFALLGANVVSSVGNNITTLTVPTRPPSPCHQFQWACSVVRGYRDPRPTCSSLVGGAVPPSGPPGWIAPKPPAWIDGAGRRVTLLLEVIAGG